MSVVAWAVLLLAKLPEVGEPVTQDVWDTASKLAEALEKHKKQFDDLV